MGVPSASFTNTYTAKVTDLMINMVEFIQAMDNLKNPISTIGPGPGPAPVPDAGNRGNHVNRIDQLEKNRNGYPILPDPLPNDSFKKTGWDTLFTNYLGQQYHLATGGKIMHIPYKRISENELDFIDSKYLPPNTIFRPPRNIPLQEIKGIFAYLLERQRLHGPEDTFRFKSIKLKGETVPSQYKPIDNTEREQNSGPGPGPGPEPAPERHPTPSSNPITHATNQLNTPPLSQPPTNLGPRNISQTETNTGGDKDLPRPRPRPKTRSNINSSITTNIPQTSLSTGTGTGPVPGPARERPRPRPITRNNKK
jgi:hypothetical protein